MRINTQSKLTDRKLAWARAVWVVLALTLAGSLIASIPAYFRDAVNSPTSSVVPDGPTESDIVLRLLAEIDLAPGRFALYQVMWRLAPSLLYLSLGLLLFLRRPDDRGALIMATVFLFNGTHGGSISTLPLSSPPQSLAEGLLLAFALLNEWATPLVFYLLPDGRFVPRWTRGLAVAFFLFLAPHHFFPGTPLDPYLYPVLLNTYGLLGIGTFIYAPLYRYFRVADARQRQQLKWVLVGVLAIPSVWLFNGALSVLSPVVGEPTATGIRYELAYWAWSTPFYLLSPLSLGFAVLRYRLWDIDVIIRRTVQYSILTGLLALIYFGGVVLFQSVFRTASGETSSLAIVLSTLIIAALFAPLRRRVQNLIDRRFFRQKYDAAKVLADFARTARDETDINKLTNRLVAVVQETLQPEQVTLWLKEQPKPKAKFK